MKFRNYKGIETNERIREKKLPARGKMRNRKKIETIKKLITEFEHKKKFEQVQWTKLEKLVTFLSILMQIMHKLGYNPVPELLLVFSYQSL